MCCFYHNKLNNEAAKWNKLQGLTLSRDRSCRSTSENLWLLKYICCYFRPNRSGWRLDRDMGLMNAIGLQPRHPAPSVTSQGTQTPVIQLQNAETQTERDLSEPSVSQSAPSMETLHHLIVPDPTPDVIMPTALVTLCILFSLVKHELESRVAGSGRICPRVPSIWNDRDVTNPECPCNNLFKMLSSQPVFLYLKQSQWTPI